MEDNAITGAVFGRFDAERYYQTLLDCVRQIKERTDFIPDTAVVLGSGLGHFVDAMDVAAEIPYSEIDGFPVSTVAGHQGKLVFGEIGGKKVAAMQGRVHYYEGYDVHDVVIPIRVLKLLGAKTAVFTNAVGAINTDYRPGDFVALRDHISSFTPSPLVGENIAQLGERFTPVTDLYDKGLRELAISIGQEKDIRVHSGVFLQVTGPQYETPAEIRMFRLLGADTVGMSTAIEATAAKHMGMRVCAINCVTN
ncbi:MAG: purine-nucleoside phosphorylase, partial [Oscillospiraceae bacterium]|nr:purine-nucleoside phosphorylase [Oscillospiraceae bacterium]